MSVLLLDMSGCNSAQLAHVIELGRRFIEQAAPNSLLTMTDVTRIIVREQSIHDLVAFVRQNKPYVRAAAVVGVSGLTRSILATTNILTGRAIKAFDTRLKALQWLTSLAAEAK